MKNYEKFLSKNESAQLLDNRLKIFVNEYWNYYNKYNGNLRILDIGVERMLNYLIIK